MECLEGPEGCRGPVEMRWPGYGEKPWPRCQHHGDERERREDENVRRYNPDGPGPPSGFDPTYAGESWDYDVGGAVGADGGVYSDADGGL
jgi:hypothetical protein